MRKKIKEYPRKKNIARERCAKRKKDGREEKKLSMREDTERSSCVQVPSSQFSFKGGKT